MQFEMFYQDEESPALWDMGQDLNISQALNRSYIEDSCHDNWTKELALNNQTANPSVPKEKWAEFQVGKDLLIYLLPPIIILGTIGNTLSFIVFLQKPMRKTSICFYLAMLSIADTIVLYLSAFKTWIRTLTGFEILHVSDVGCKAVMLLLLISLHMSAWLIVVMTVDRFVAVWIPFKAHIVCTPSNARAVSLGLLIVCLLINIHATWSYHIQHLDEGKVCHPYKNDHFMIHMYPYMKLISYSLLPFVLVLILNMGIIIQLWKSHHRKTEIHRPSHAARTKAAPNRMTVVLLCISLIWLVLTAPVMLWTLVTPESTDSHTIARMFLIKIICFLFMYINHSINFFIYCITGQRFQRELTNLFTPRRKQTNRMRLTLIKSTKDT